MAAIAAAASQALALSCSDPDFWSEAIECDGEASVTELISVDEDDGSQET